MIHARCIFCKGTDCPFTSREHVVPESLGNLEYVLPIGIVCDRCNNYFANKIEGPLLSSDYFRHLRFSSGIPNKKGRVPTLQIMSYPDGILLESGQDRDGSRYLSGIDDEHSDRLIQQLLEKKTLTAVFPMAISPEARLFARFLLLVAIRALAHRIVESNTDLLSELVEKPELEDARQFVRYSSRIENWPIHEHRIYSVNQRFRDELNQEVFTVPHEFTFVYTESQELYFVIAIFGMQYAINIAGPEIEGFEKWHLDHGGLSPLYP